MSFKGSFSFVKAMWMDFFITCTVFGQSFTYSFPCWDDLCTRKQSWFIWHIISVTVSFRICLRSRQMIVFWLLDDCNLGKLERTEKMTRDVYSICLFRSMVLCHLNNVRSLKPGDIKMVVDRNSTIF